MKGDASNMRRGEPRICPICRKVMYSGYVMYDVTSYTSEI